MNSDVKNGGVYKHFKGTNYVVVCVATDSKGYDYIVYYASNDRKKKKTLFARPIDMFKSKVDKVKYPDANQEKRFQYQGKHVEVNIDSLGTDRIIHTEEPETFFKLKQRGEQWLLCRLS